MYIITIQTPANDAPHKMVKTYYVGDVKKRGIEMTDWDEDIKWAKRYTDKIDALKKRSLLRKLQGSEKAKVELAKKFSKN